MNGCVINAQARILQRTESVFLTIIIFLSLKKNECAVSDQNLIYDNSHIFVFDRKMFSEMIGLRSTVFDTLISTSFQYYARGLESFPQFSHSVNQIGNTLE